MTASHTFAEWALSLKSGDIPPSVQHSASRHLLDGLGVAIAATRLGEMQPVIDIAMRTSSPAEATVIGQGTRLPAPAVALANGALVHALDYDDTHAGALVHATAAVLPAAFAVAEEVLADGSDILVAAVAGYELVTRLGAAVTHGFHARGFHATSVCGVFASALIGSRLYGLSVEQTVNALGIAGSLASGSLEFLHTGSSTKQLHPGFSGMNGIVAARLAAAGMDGPASIFEGEYGTFAAFTGTAVDAASLTEGLGTRWETERITIKPYPACQLSHASLDALRPLGAVDVAAIDSITFELPPESIPIVCEPVASKQQPRTPYEGKFSLPYCAASLLIDGELGVESFAGTKLQRPNVLALAARVRHVARVFEGAPADAPGIVEVRLHDGRALSGEVKRSRGTPEEPLSDAELVFKLSANCGGDSPKARKMVDDMLDIASLPSIGPIMQMTESFR